MRLRAALESTAAVLAGVAVAVGLFVVLTLAADGTSRARLAEAVELARVSHPVPIAAPRLFPIHVVRVIDGDTVIGDIELPWQVALWHVRIRAATYDACETSRRRKTVHITDEELVKGREAAQALATALQSGDLYAAPWIDARDRYGRVLAVLWIDRQGKLERLRDWMKARGYLRRER